MLFVKRLGKFSSSKMNLIGYPFAGGQGRKGVEDTPRWLFEQNWYRQLKRENENKIVEELMELENNEHNLSVNKIILEGHKQGALNFNQSVKCAELLGNRVYESLKSGHFTIVVGGDHSQAIGSISGVRRQHPDCKVVWIDAHIDCNSPATSPSGNIHGMPCAFLTGQVEGHPPSLALKDICYLGIRSYESQEKQLIQDNDVLHFQSSHCEIHNIPSILQDINLYFKNTHHQSTPIWLTFDIDGLCGTQFQSTGTPEPNGIQIQFIQQFLLQIIQSHNVIGIDISEINFQKLSDLNIIQQDQLSTQAILTNIVSAYFSKSK